MVGKSKKKQRKINQQKKDLLYLSAKTKEKAHSIIKQPDRPFTLRDHVMTLKTEKSLLKKEHTIYTFMTSGLVFLAVGLALIFLFQDILYETIGWVAVIIGFLEILESYHRMERWKKARKRQKK